jgi:hypothetical protein
MNSGLGHPEGSAGDSASVPIDVRQQDEWPLIISGMLNTRFQQEKWLSIWVPHHSLLYAQPLTTRVDFSAGQEYDTKN